MSARDLAVMILKLAILFSVLSCCASAGCARREFKTIHLSKGNSSPSPNHQGQAKQSFRVAVAGVISIKESRKSYQELLNCLGRRLDRPVEWIQRSTYAEINNLIRTGSVDLAFVCSSAYIAGKREFDMELLVAPEIKGERVYHSYIIVPRDALTRSFSDLRGKTFAFTDPMSLSGRLYPASILVRLGQRPEQFFKKVVYTYSHDYAVKAVSQKWVDGAAVDSLVYHFLAAQDPSLPGRVRVIHKSPSFGIPPVVVHPDLNPSLKARLRRFFLNLSNDPQGRQVLRRLKIDRFTEVSDDQYDSARQIEAVVLGKNE